MISGEPWRLEHRPGLDGLRGVAILLVLVCHAGDWVRPTAMGSVGVTLFFTLSGFLITALLLREVAGRGRLSWSSFYARRARRLLPALVVVVTLFGSMQVAIAPSSVGQVLAVVAYVGNWPLIHGGGDVGLLRHTWSLAIEEQFYLLWPLALVIALRWRNGPVVLACAGIAGSLAARFWLWDGGAGSDRVYFGSDTRADALLVGCLLAILMARGVRLPAFAPWMAAVSILALVVLVNVWRTAWADVIVVPTITPWIAAAAIVACLNRQTGWATWTALRWFGRRSYGLYLWHFPLALATYEITSSVPAVWVMLGLSIGVAELSWRWIEEPFLRAGRGRSERRGQERPRLEVAEVDHGVLGVQPDVLAGLPLAGADRVD